MRNAAVVLVSLLFATTVAAAQKQILGARSEHHELRLERTVVAPDTVSYHVRLVDLDSGKTVLESDLSGGPADPVQAGGSNGVEEFRVRLAYTPTFFSATVNVTRGELIADEFRTWWQLAPRPGERQLDAAGALRVGGDVKAPVVVNRVEAQYTPEARKARIGGIVIIEAIVGKDGRVKDARVLKPLPFGLAEAALDAVKQWTFKPGTLNGEPVDVIFNLTVNFHPDTPPPQ